MSAVLEAWTYEATGPGAVSVVPDGCRDVLVVQAAGDRPRLLVTELDDAMRTVSTPGRVSYWGFRLRPGATVAEAALRAAWEASEDLQRLPEFVGDEVRVDPQVDDALTVLATGVGVSAAARRLGVSTRTLQRKTAQGTGRSPGFWHALARIRHAGRLMSGERTLAAVAADAGFADQAHLTRECRRWLGAPPRGIRHRPDLLDQLAAPGYDPPIGEQISTT